MSQFEERECTVPNPLPSPECYLLEEARGYISLGDYEGANRTLNFLPHHLCFQPAVLEVRRVIFERSGQHHEALACAQAISSLMPGHPRAWRWQAASLARLKRDEDCLRVIFKALQTWPLDATMAMVIVRSQCRLERLPEARRWFKRALALSKDPERLTSQALQDADLKKLWEEKI